MIIKMEDRETKETICTEILEALPQWFGIPESRVTYAKTCREIPVWVDVEAKVVKGFIAMKETSKYTAEVYVMGVKQDYHRLGIGRKLFEAFYSHAREKGYEFIQVKTVREGRYAEYDFTNAFYQKIGFREFECIDCLWDEANPCQVYVMAVK